MRTTTCNHGSRTQRVQRRITHAVRVYRRPGHVFGPFRRGADRAGAILAVGDSRDDALARAAAAAEVIRFELAAADEPPAR